MVIYIDIIFIENLILDFIILLATGIICNCKIKIWRLILASILGSTSTVASFVIGINKFYIKILISFIIIFVGFGFNNKKNFIKKLGTFYLTTFTFGGASFMLLFFVSPEKLIYEAGHFMGLYPVKMALIRRNIWIYSNSSSAKNANKKISKNM